MKVNLGTLEISDRERKAIGRGKLATREQVRKWAFGVIAKAAKERKTSFEGDFSDESEEEDMLWYIARGTKKEREDMLRGMSAPVRRRYIRKAKRIHG